MRQDKLKSVAMEIAKAMEQAAVNSHKMTPKDVISTYDNIESLFLSKLSGYPDQFIEVKRRVAEWKFFLLSERNLPFEDIFQLYEAISKVGFTNLEREANVEICLSRYFLLIDRPEEAEAVLKKLLHKLVSALSSGDIEPYKSLKHEVEVFLSKIRRE
ncbi:MAG: hypothetical protein WAU91_11130 [Desulfatitalea sp.]